MFYTWAKHVESQKPASSSSSSTGASGGNVLPQHSKDVSAGLGMSEVKHARLPSLSEEEEEGLLFDVEMAERKGSPKEKERGRYD